MVKGRFDQIEGSNLFFQLWVHLMSDLIAIFACALVVKRFTHKVSLFFQKHRVFYVLASKSIWAFEKSSGKLSILSSYLGNFTYVKSQEGKFQQRTRGHIVESHFAGEHNPALVIHGLLTKMRKKGGDRLRFSKHG